jgi:hypothetical protein
VDFWRVNSYSYPNPFVESNHARQAWETFESFAANTSYQDLKSYWASSSAPRNITSHAVESWKATFEEFGLLYVLSGQDEVIITPAGRQLREAAASGTAREFGWIGLSLLMRYPLRGPRRSRGGAHEMSDVLVYWLFYAALRELGNQLWWSEFERVLSGVFRTSGAAEAIDRIRWLRANPDRVEDLPLPVAERQGAFYNSLNQVVVHAGMNGMVLGTSHDEAYYRDIDPPRRHWIRHEWIDLIDVALGGAEAACTDTSAFAARLPTAPTFDTEEEYFSYVGALVPPPHVRELSEIVFEGGRVAILDQAHYSYAEDGYITGGPELCRLVREQRILLRHDQRWSYIVTDKTRVDAGRIRLTVRRARPIIDPSPLSAISEEEPGV